MKASKKYNIIQEPQKAIEDHIYQDALEFENHQRLPVLFCSFYHNENSTNSCAPPTFLDMKFYGQHDIMLGQFLQRYCFMSICPSCKLPMLGHIRRYVHSMGCVEVFLGEDNTPSSIISRDSNDIYLTSWCQICSIVTPTIPLSDTTKSLSFAKYLELRFHAHNYKKRSEDDAEDSDKCKHSLHRDYIHTFIYKGVAAKFVYKPIEVYEIGLPPCIINLERPRPFESSSVMEDVKKFSVRGHEVYSKIHEKIADLATDEQSPLVTELKDILKEDQFIFRHHEEIVQTLLTEKNANG